MSEYLDPRGPGRSALSARNLLIALSVVFTLWLAVLPVTPGHVAYTAFIITATLTAWIMSRGSVQGVQVERVHRRRVFEDDTVAVELIVRQTAGLAQTLILVEDQFLASLSVRQRHLIPLLSPRWEAHLQYRKDAERHRGLYLLGPVRMWAADPLGVFFRRAGSDCITRLTVYPRAAALGGYRLLGPEPRLGPGIEAFSRLGQGEEIISVRPYRPGDPPNRIHWRTSVRRREMHTMELDAHVQGEAALFLDLTRAARYGTGAESTTETAIGCAVSILTEAGALRHRLSLTWVRNRVEAFPAGAGVAHLHMLLDRLATVSFGGDRPFWRDVAPHAAMLNPGSRAIFIAPAATTPHETAGGLIRRLALHGVAVDIILMDESNLTRLWRDQDPTRERAGEDYDRLRGRLERAGARVLPLARGQSARHLLPRAAAWRESKGVKKP